MAHLQLGDALAQLGDAGAATTSFTNAVELLAGMAAGREVAGADGIAVARLRQIAEARLASLRAGSDR
jgi:hypothetical protein